MPEHIVVDGSNIATEGRQLPSLAQLEDALAELRREMPDAILTVVVDATFAHRIDASERDRFDTGFLEGRYVHPPAGAIGRGDAFLLRIAEKVDGIVLSNDSFQEFHGEHPWLFERGRLLGAMPVPGVGWIFVPRTPVRGARSQIAVRESTRARAAVEKAIAVATKEAVAGPVVTPRTSTARTEAAATNRLPQAVNDPMTFISFIAEHRLGEEIEATVESFTSHGAVVSFGAVRCYVPLSSLGDPAPKSAREVLKKGETRRFIVTSLDPYRRGVELALPGADVSGRPSADAVAAAVEAIRVVAPRTRARRSRSARPEEATTPETPRPRARRRSASPTSPSGSATGGRAATAAVPPAPAPAPSGGPRRRTRAEPAPTEVVATSSAPTAKRAPRAGTPLRRLVRRRSKTSDTETSPSAPKSEPE